jgi:hypothetical protein
MIFNGAEYGILMNISNFGYQIIAVQDPKSDLHFKINCIYSACTLISIALYIIGYCKNSKYVITAFQIVALRNLARLFDFEQSRFFM